MKRLIGCLLLLSFVSCTPVLLVPRGGPPPHAPAHGRRAKRAALYRYYYYPDVEVYYYPARKTYVVLQNGVWVTMTSRPAILLPAYTYVTLELGEPKPWLKHKKYRKKYPPGLLKKKHKGKGPKW